MKNSTIYKILSYIKSYNLIIALSLIFSLLQVVATLYIPILIGYGVDCIVGKNNVDFERIVRLIIIAVIVTIAGGISQWLASICNNKITYGVVKDIRQEAFEKLHKLPLSYIDAQQTGDVVSRLIADVDQFADGLLLGFTQFFVGIMTILGTLLFMLYLNPLITVVVVCLTPISFFVAKFIATHIHDMFELQSRTRGEQTSLIEEVLGNVNVVKAYSMEDKIDQSFNEINGRLKDCSKKAVFYSSLTNPCTRFVNSIVYAAVAVIGAIATIMGGITVGGLTSFLAYANQYTKPFNEISGVITELQNAVVCARRVFELIEEAEESENVELKRLPEMPQRVEISDVSFSYDKSKSLIEGLSLQVEPGSKVAIVGPTGCGKSTIINLLMRFYDVDKGEISIEDTDIREVSRRSLRKNYGMVLQETWLKNGTVFENLTIGKKDATLSEVMEAAKAAHAHSFIMKMPKGYDTVLKEDGAGLSAGQKQLLCIARVMLEVPPMLILDEATSSIDTRTEQKIQAAFGTMMKNRTSFIVAHRLSTIQNADVILVMKDGKIIEQGNHDTLLDMNGFYAKLYNSQFAVS